MNTEAIKVLNWQEKLKLVFMVLVFTAAALLSTACGSSSYSGYSGYWYDAPEYDPWDAGRSIRRSRRAEWPEL